MVNPDLIDLPDLPRDTRGIYVFHGGQNYDCSPLSFRFGYSKDIRQRLHGYHLVLPKGVHLCGLLLARTNFEDAELRQMEAAFKRFLIGSPIREGEVSGVGSKPGVELLKMTVRNRGTGEWVTVEARGNKRPWERMTDLCKQFYRESSIFLSSRFHLSTGH